MTIPSPDGADPLITDEDILQRAAFLTESAVRRQLWLILIAEDGRQLPVLPLIDIPKRPDEPAVRLLVHRLTRMAEAADAAEVAVVYERPGPERLTVADRQWLRLLATGRGGSAVRVRGPVLAHARGVRWIAPEDLEDPVRVGGARGGGTSP